MNTTLPSAFYNNVSKTKQRFSLKQMLATSLLIVALPLTSAAIAHDNAPNDRECSMGHDSHGEKWGGMHHGMGHHNMGKPGVPYYLHNVQLTPTQEDQIFAITYPQIPTMREQHKQHKQLMDELRTATQADKFDEAKVQQLADQLANLDKEKIMSRARNNAKIFAVLTPEQRTKVREIKMRDHGYAASSEHGEREHLTGYSSAQQNQSEPHLI